MNFQIQTLRTDTPRATVFRLLVWTDLAKTELFHTSEHTSKSGAEAFVHDHFPEAKSHATLRQERA